MQKVAVRTDEPQIRDLLFRDAEHLRQHVDEVIGGAIRLVQHRQIAHRHVLRIAGRNAPVRQPPPMQYAAFRFRPSLDLFCKPTAFEVEQCRPADDDVPNGVGRFDDHNPNKFAGSKIAEQ